MKRVILPATLLTLSALLLWEKPAGAYPIPPVLVAGGPVAPPIENKQGDGFCVFSRQAYTGYDRGNVIWLDAHHFFPNEVYHPPSMLNPDARAILTDTRLFTYIRRPLNTRTAGTELLRRVEQFFTNPFGGLSPITGPTQVGPIYVGKFSKFFDLSSNPNSYSGATLVDPNGDTQNGNPADPACPNPLGCSFKFGQLVNLNALENRYEKRPLLKQMFPEASNADEFRDTATRFIGYLNVQKSWVGRRILFAAYFDDAGSITIRDGNGNKQTIISVASNRCESCATDVACNSSVQAGDVEGPTMCRQEDVSPRYWCQPCSPYGTGPRWRVTGEVKFLQAGLYPIEINHIQYAGNAAAEIYMHVVDPVEDSISSTFKPVHENWGHSNLDPTRTYDEQCNGDVGICRKTIPALPIRFQLLDPRYIFQSISGNPIDCSVKLCDPAAPNNANCVEGSYCNPAGFCEPCISNGKCGKSCQTCGGDTPACGSVNNAYKCTECNENSDCAGKQQCSASKTCTCQSDGDCPKGESCDGGRCQPCKTDNSCGGVSCSPCPAGTHCGKVKGMYYPCEISCAPKEVEVYTCVECRSIADCTDPNKPVCDPINGRCVPQVPTCNTNDRCGANCEACPSDRPYCSNGKVCVRCKQDSDCPSSSEFCLSGDCVPCSTERRCGYGCRTCPPDKPFCNGAGEFAYCTGCTEDSQCGPGMICDPVAGKCQGCTVSCGSNEFCYGNVCVKCVNEAGLPMGEYCTFDPNHCNGPQDCPSGVASGCKDNNDCLANECCKQGTCYPGRCKPSLEPAGGALCACSLPPKAPPGTPSFSLWTAHPRNSFSGLVWLLSISALLSGFLLLTRSRLKKQTACNDLQ